MNLFKAILDTIHQNGVIGPITQFDNATLELQILTGGQVGESWNSPQFELIAMKRDMNPVREVDQDKFTILSNEDHRVRIELKKQFLTCRGTVKMQLIVEDGSRTSTTIFRLSIAQSLDATIIESIKDVKVLDDLDEVVESLTTLNTMAEDNEAKRQHNEKLREVAESNRQDEFDKAQSQRDTEFNEKLNEFQEQVGGLKGEKGEKGDSGGVVQSDMVDYMGEQHDSLKETNDANVEYLLRKLNTQKYESSFVTATNTYAKKVNHVFLKGVTLKNLVDDPKNTKGTWSIFYGDVDENGVWYFQSNVVLVRYAQQKIPVKHNTTYTAFLKCKNKNTNNTNANIGLYLESIDGGSRIAATHENVLSDDYVLLKCKITTTTHNSVTFRLHARGLVGEVWFKDFMFIEGDYTKQDIPYFEGMASVKSPMLTVTNADSTQSHTLVAPSDLIMRSVGDVCDALDLNTGEYIKRIETRPYQQGDETNAEVLTDKVNTIYKLVQPITTKIDLEGQKVYSYDGTTHYTCTSEENHLAPILSIDVPTNLSALVSHQRDTIQALTIENQEIKAVNEAQDIEIALNQDAINFMLFQSSSMSLLEETKGTNTMAAYLANQILKGRLDYTLVISRYCEFKEDIDTILIAEGKQDLIK